MLARTNMYYCPFVIFCSFYLALLLNCDSGSHFRINVTKSNSYNSKQVNVTQRKSFNKTSMRVMQVTQLVPQMTKRTHVQTSLLLYIPVHFSSFLKPAIFRFQSTVTTIPCYGAKMALMDGCSSIRFATSNL